jgi:hypothetical protein
VRVWEHEPPGDAAARVATALSTARNYLTDTESTDGIERQTRSR